MSDILFAPWGGGWCWCWCRGVGLLSVDWAEKEREVAVLLGKNFLCSFLFSLLSFYILAIQYFYSLFNLTV